MPLDDRDLELLSAYIDNALTAEERAGIESRLAADAALRQELERLRLTKNLIGALPMLQPPRPLTVTRAMVTPHVLRFPATVAFSALSAAAAVIMLLAGVILLSTTQELDETALSVAQAPTAAATLIELTATDSVQVYAQQEEEQAASQAAQPTGDAFNAVPAALPTTTLAEATGGELAGAAAAELPAPIPQGTLVPETILPFGGVVVTTEAQDAAADIIAPSLRQAESATAEPDVALELAPMAAMIASETPTLAPTLAPATFTLEPSATLLPTRTPMPTSAPTATPIPEPAAARGDGSSVGIALIIIAALLFVLSATAFMRRNG